MKVENVNEWIYYFFIKDEEAFDVLSQHYKPMMLSVCRQVCGNEYLEWQTIEDFFQLGDMILLECLLKYRFDLTTDFSLFFYVNLRNRAVDEGRYMIHSTFSPYFSAISLDQKIREDNNMYYRDIVENINGINEENFILTKSEVEYYMSIAKKKLKSVDYGILSMYIQGYSMKDICTKYGISRQGTYYHLKKAQSYLLSLTKSKH